MLVSAGAKAQTEFTATTADGNTLKYLVVDADKKYVRCTGLDGTAQTTCTIPATVTDNGTTYEVKSIGYDAFRGQGFTNVSIANGVDTLFGQCFYNCLKLVSVQLPSTLKVMETQVFRLCQKLESLIIPESVKEYVRYAYSNATGQYTGSSYYGWYTYQSGIKYLYLPGSISNAVRDWGSGAFNNMTSLKKLDLGATMTAAPENLFTSEGNTVMQQLVLPSKMKSIGAKAFFSFTGLKTVYCLAQTPPAVANINAFNSADNVKNITLMVPKGTKDAYEADAIWKQFGSIVETDLTLPIIPDYTLRSYIYNNWDTDEDGLFSQDELKAPTQLPLNNTDGNKITDLTGIEHFTNLAKVEVNGHGITAADLSANTAITTFSGSGQSATLQAVNMGGGRFGVRVPSVAKASAITSFKLNSQQATPEVISKSGDTYITFPVDATGDYVITYDYNPGIASLPDATMDVTVHTTVANLFYAVDDENFPDPVWRSYISTTYDKDADGYLNAEELAAISAVKTIGTVGVAALTATTAIAPFTYTAYKNETTRIHNLKGIELFTALEQLNLRGNNIEELDLSQNRQLRVINLHFNELLSELVLPEVEHNANCSIYVGGCFALQDLDLRPLSSNNNKVYIGTGGTVAAALNFTTNPSSSTNQKALRRVVLPANIANTTLPFSYMLQLNNLDASHVATSAVTTLTLNSCSALRKIDTDEFSTVFRNKLSTLNATSTTGLETLRVKDCAALMKIEQSISKALATIELDNLPKITNINITGNTSEAFPRVIDLSQFTTITGANLSTNVNLEEINTTGLNKMLSLNAHGSVTWEQKYLKRITGLETNTALTTLTIYNNDIEEIDVTKNTKLKTLNMYTNRVKTIDLSQNTALTTLLIANNLFTEIDIKNNTELTSLHIYTNQIDTLDLAANTALTTLSAYGNRLKTLDLTNNPQISILNVYDNNLQSIRLSSETTALAQVKIQDNSLLAFDLTGRDFTGYNTAANDQYILSPQTATLPVLNINGKAAIQMPYAVAAEYITDLTIDGNEATPAIETINDTTYLILKAEYLASDWLAEKGVVSYKMNPNVSCTKEDSGTAASLGVKAERLEVTINTYPEDEDPNAAVDLYVSELGQAADGKYYSSMFYSYKALTVPEGAVAYTYKVADKRLTESHTYSPGDVIPAGQAVVVAADNAAMFRFETATTEGVADPNSMLFGTDQTQTVDDSGYTYYELSLPPANTDYEIGFWQQTSDGLSILNQGHKAFLRVPTDEASGIKGFSFGQTTGITVVDNAYRNTGDAKWYTLDGQRLGSRPTQKGVYIIGGKKVVVK